MLFRLIKKITKNLGVFLSLFFGIILSLVIINAIAIYGNSLSDILLQKEISKYEKNYNQTAGTAYLSYNCNETSVGFSKEIEDYNISTLNNANMDIEVGRTMAIANESVFWKEGAKIDSRSYFYHYDYELISIKDFENHVDIVEGRMFNNSFFEQDKNVLEVLVDKTTLFNLSLNVGELYRIELLNLPSPSRVADENKRVEELGINKNYLKVVGVYEFKENDLFWRKGEWNNSQSHFIANGYPLSLLSQAESKSLQFSSEYFFDLSNFKYTDREKFTKDIDKISSDLNGVKTSFHFNIYNLLLEENNDMKLVNNMLWIIQIPLLVIVFLYILMITGIIVDRDKDEIALLKVEGQQK